MYGSTLSLTSALDGCGCSTSRGEFSRTIAYIFFVQNLKLGLDGVSYTVIRLQDGDHGIDSWQVQGIFSLTQSPD